MIALTAVTEMNERQLEIFCHCEKFFFDHEKPALVNKYAHYFTEGYDAFGISEEEMKLLRDEVLSKWEPSVQELAELGRHFFATGKYEFGSLAIMLLKKHRPRFDREVYESVKLFTEESLANWAHADLISTKITPVFLELEIANMEDFAEWRSSPSKWSRRVSAVTMLWQRGKLPPAELLDFMRPLMSDPERVVHQGVGWFLRELWRLFPTEVEEFLLEHKDSAPRLIIQYATEKMSKDKKRRFRKTTARERSQDRQGKKSFGDKRNLKNRGKPQNRQGFKSRRRSADDAGMPFRIRHTEESDE